MKSNLPLRAVKFVLKMITIGMKMIVSETIVLFGNVLLSFEFIKIV